MSRELYLCLYAREFPAQALLRLRPELRSKAIAVLDGEAPFQKVCSLNRHARSLGVTSAMSRAEIDDFPSVTLLKRSLAEEADARCALLECAGSFSPRVEDNNGGEAFLCVLDISGTEKLFGTAQDLAARILKTIGALGITCSLAASANLPTAVCLAKGANRTKSPVIVPPGEERQALASLPLSVLEMATDYVETFVQWGITDLGMLAALPERDLIARLGQEGKRLRQLARGEHPHLFQPVETELALAEHIEWDSPVEILDSLLFGVSLMVEQLIARASARALSLAAIASELGLEGGNVHTRTVRPAMPSNDRALWLKLLHLDWIAHPPQAPVLTMRLHAGEASKVQLGLFSPQLPEAGRLDVTLARILSIVGEERVGSAELKDTHAPDAFRMKPFSVLDARNKKAIPISPVSVMRRLRPSEPVTVTLRDRCPNIFYFRGVQYQAERTYGPWHIAGGWWTQEGWSLEAWDILARVRDKRPTNQMAGLLCCSLTRNTANDCWQMEALYD